MEEKDKEKITKIENELNLIRIKLGIRPDGTHDGNGLTHRVMDLEARSHAAEKDQQRTRDDLKDLKNNLLIKEQEVKRDLASKAEHGIVLDTLKKGKEWVGALIFLAALLFGIMALQQKPASQVPIQQQQNINGNKK